MIVLVTPKGWTGPKEADGLPVEGTYRAHQVAAVRAHRAPRAPPRSSKPGCGSIAPRSCSTRAAGSFPTCAKLAPNGERRMGANAHANGGILLRDLRLPEFRDYAIDVPRPGNVMG